VGRSSANAKILGGESKARKESGKFGKALAFTKSVGVLMEDLVPGRRKKKFHWGERTTSPSDFPTEKGKRKLCSQRGS